MSSLVVKVAWSQGSRGVSGLVETGIRTQVHISVSEVVEILSLEMRIEVGAFRQASTPRAPLNIWKEIQSFSLTFMIVLF